jgi:hypothetical protein
MGGASNNYGKAGIDSTISTVPFLNFSSNILIKRLFYNTFRNSIFRAIEKL